MLLGLLTYSCIHRSVNKQIYQSVQVSDAEAPGQGGQDEFKFNEVGWKKLAGDVFRKPPGALMLSIFLGNGIHLWTMGMCLLLISMLGIAKPDHFGNMVIFLFVMYLISSSIIGIASARFYKLF